MVRQLTFDFSHDFSYNSPLFAEPEGIAMWNANVPNQFGADQRDTTMDFPDLQSYDPDFGPLSGNYSEASFDFSHASGSNYDPFSSYTQSSVSNSDYAMPAARHSVKNVFTQCSSDMKPSHRRQSAQSVAASSIQRPSSTYTESNFLVHSAAMSPTSAMGHLFPGEDPYSVETNRFMDFSARINPSRFASPLGGSDDEQSGSSQIDSLGDIPPRSHELYHAYPADDGLYHCPFVASENCGHEPKSLKCEYDKHIDSHLKPFRCKSSKCRELQFSSTACLLRHEREAHDMHGHAESLCEYPPCNRSQPGHGFRRSYNCKDHMTRCHGWVDTAPIIDKKKNRHSTLSSSSGKKGVSKQKNKVPSKKQQIARLKQEWEEHKAQMENLSRTLAPDGPLMSMQITQIQNEAQMLASISAELSKLQSRG